MADVIKSISFEQGEIIKNILKLHVPGQNIDCDCTYSKGVFYKQSGITPPKYKFDIFPQTIDTVKADCRALPLENDSLNCLMFDPPFVIASGHSLNNGKTMSNIISNRFSCFANTQDLYNFYFEALTEFQRVLKDNGVLIVKCQDTVSGGTNYMSHIYIHNMALKLGFYPKDLFVLNSKTRIISSKHKRQLHARKYHSYFWVFEKANPKIVKVAKYNCLKGS